jgi:hypothetical protein
MRDDASIKKILAEIQSKLVQDKDGLERQLQEHKRTPPMAAKTPAYDSYVEKLRELEKSLKDVNRDLWKIDSVAGDESGRRRLYPLLLEKVSLAIVAKTIARLNGACDNAPLAIDPVSSVSVVVTRAGPGRRQFRN